MFVDTHFDKLLRKSFRLSLGSSQLICPTFSKWHYHSSFGVYQALNPVVELK